MLAGVRRHGRQLALWGITLLASVVLTEGALRVTALASPTVYSALYHHRVPDARLGWRFDSNFPDIDSRGFRNERVPDSAEIVVLGDSQSYGYGVALGDSWPCQLGRRLGRAVYTMAGSGYGPGHSLLLWEDAVALGPDLVIAAFYSGNDLYDAYDLVYSQGKLPHLQTADANVLAQMSCLEAQGPLATAAERVTRMGETAWPLRDFLRDHSRIFGMVRSFGHRSQALATSLGTPLDWEGVRRRALAHADYCDPFDDGQVRTVFTCRKRHLALNLADPRLREGRRLSLVVIDEMQRRAREAGFEFAVLLIPTKEYVFVPRVRAQGPLGCAVLDELVAREAALWYQMRAHLTAQGILWIDALPALRHCLELGDSPYRITSDGHPNAVGCAAIAGEVTRRLAAGEI